MGFIKAFTGALSGSFADQWKDFYGPAQGVSPTAVVFQALPHGTNSGIGENTKGFENVITNGSKFVVPEGTALITLQDGLITGFIAEAGGYIYQSNDPNSRSLFAGNGIFASTFGQSWEKFKFGGQPGSQQIAFYINLKEISGNKFGTSETIYWNDSYLDLKAGGMARGTYSIKIVDPLLFIKNFVPQQYLQPNAPVFDFADMDNQAGEQLFHEFVTCLSGAISRLSQQAKINDVDTMDFIQGNQDKFAVSMSEEINNTYQWQSMRGIQVQNVSVVINYDAKTQEILDEIRKDDRELRKARKLGEAYQNNMAGMVAAASSEALKGAASNEKGTMMGFMGMNMAQQAGVNMLESVQSQSNSSISQPTQSSVSSEDPYIKLTKLKKLLEEGVITQEDFDAAKKQLLGI